jgi:hypothetical protein
MPGRPSVDGQDDPNDPGGRQDERAPNTHPALWIHGVTLTDTAAGWNTTSHHPAADRVGSPVQLPAASVDLGRVSSLIQER